MPDPLLTRLEFDADYRTSEGVAAFYGVNIQQSGRLVFLDCRGTKGQLLAQIDCTNYPERLPDVTFLDPSTNKPTAESRFWPPGVAGAAGPQGSGLCMAGTSTYGMAHGSSFAGHSLATLVELVILCCKGQAQKLRFIPGR